MTTLNTPSPETLRAVAAEALRRTAEARGSSPDSVHADAIAGLTELMIVAARIEAKAAAKTAGGVDTAA